MDELKLSDEAKELLDRVGLPTDSPALGVGVRGWPLKVWLKKHYPKLGLRAVGVYEALSDFHRMRGGRAFPSLETLLEGIHGGRTVLKQAIAELERAGLVAVVPQRGRSNLFVLLHTPEGRIEVPAEARTQSAGVTGSKPLGGQSAGVTGGQSAGVTPNLRSEKSLEKTEGGSAPPDTRGASAQAAESPRAQKRRDRAQKLAVAREAAEKARKEPQRPHELSEQSEALVAVLARQGDVLFEGPADDCAADCSPDPVSQSTDAVVAGDPVRASDPVSTPTDLGAAADQVPSSTDPVSAPDPVDRPTDPSAPDPVAGADPVTAVISTSANLVCKAPAGPDPVGTPDPVSTPVAPSDQVLAPLAKTGPDSMLGVQLALERLATGRTQLVTAMGALAGAAREEALASIARIDAERRKLYDELARMRATVGALKPLGRVSQAPP